MKRNYSWFKVSSMPGKVKIMLVCASLLALGLLQTAFIYPRFHIDCKSDGCRAGVNVKVDHSVRCNAYASVRTHGYAGPGFREAAGCDGYEQPSGKGGKG